MTAPPRNATAAAEKSAGWRFDNSYARLPEQLFARVAPTPVRAPGLALFNRPLAASLGLDPAALESQGGAAIFAGNLLPDGAEPIAQAYAGHQFGYFTMLGDGRAILLGEQIDPQGRRWDIQLKGSGLTPFSRRGDGRAALGPMLREFIFSEALHHLGIPTTRSLAVAVTGEPVYRDRPLRGAVLARVAASHIRVGTFEYVAALGDLTLLRALADHTIARHYPGIATRPDRYVALLENVVERQADLIAKWMLAGFIHGVMNTDNMALSGETIDFGPCAFMDAYDPKTVFSSIDHYGRYAYGNQPEIARWNLARLAEAMLPLLAENRVKAVDLANHALSLFPARYEAAWQRGVRVRLGLFEEQPGDNRLVNDLLKLMNQHQADFINTFRALADGSPLPEPFSAWKSEWQARLASEGRPVAEVRALMRSATPSVIPRNHKVEEALSAAESGSLNPLRALLAAIASPYDHSIERPEYQEPMPGPREEYKTFCGT